MVRRDRIPAGLPDQPADPRRARGRRRARGVPHPLRELQAGPAPVRRAVHRPRPLAGRRHAHRAAAPGRVAPGEPHLGAGGHRRRHAGVEPLAGVAAVPPRDQLRRSRSDLRPGRVLLRVPAPVVRVRPRRAAGPPAAGDRGLDADLPPARPRGQRRRPLRGAPRRPAPPVAAGRGDPAAAGRRDVARRLQPPAVAHRPHPGRHLRRRHRTTPGPQAARRRRRGRRRDGDHAGLHPPPVARDRGLPALRGDVGRRPDLRDGVPAPRGHPQRAGQGDALPRAQHRGHAQGVCAEQRRGAGTVRRRAAVEGGYRRERRHHRQRPAVGPAAAARHVRADPGNPHLLRLRVGRRGPLRDQRPVPPGDALGPRAELGEPAVQVVDQRAPHLHARLRPHPRPGQRGDGRGPAGAVHQEPAPGVVGRPGGDRALALLRRAVERSRVRGHEGARVPLPPRRRQRVQELRRARRRAARLDPAQADVREPVPVVQGAAERGFERREPGDLQPPDHRTRDGDCAVPDVRPRPLPGDRRRQALLDPGRLHHHGAVPVLDAHARAGSTTSGTR